MGRKIVLVWAALAALFVSAPLHASVVDMKKVGQTWEAHVVKEHNFKVPVSVYPSEARALMKRGFALNPATAVATIVAGLVISQYEAEWNHTQNLWFKQTTTNTPDSGAIIPGFDQGVYVNAGWTQVQPAANILNTCSVRGGFTSWVYYDTLWDNKPTIVGVCGDGSEWPAVAYYPSTRPIPALESVQGSPLSDAEYDAVLDQLSDAQQQALVDQVPYSDPLYDPISQRADGVSYDPATDPNTANTYTNPTTGTTSTQWPSFCKWASPVCSFIDWMKEEPPALPDPPEPSGQVESILIDDSILPNLQPRGCAIDPIEFSALGANGSIDTGPVCQLAQYASYLLLMIGGFIGFRIATGTTHKG